VQKLAAEGDSAFAAGARVVESLDDAAAIVQFFARRRERGIDQVDLSRMDTGHSRKAEATRLEREFLEPFRILKGRPDAVDCLDVSRGGSRHEGRASVNQVDGFSLTFERQIQLSGKVLGAEHQSNHPG